MDDFFCGWYFKCQSPGQTLALIPAVHRHRGHTTASIQLICDTGCWSVPVNCPHPQVLPHRPVARLGPNVFGPDGLRLDLQTPVLSARGTLRFGPPTPLRSDIMGPFRFFPMECRHGVLSMAHTLQGSAIMDGHLHSFDGGLGYSEKDSGTSFPRSYLWMQCNDFSEPCSVMVSIAHIPFCGVSFRGCICAILYQGREYRLATYRGVRIQAFAPEHICLSQGSLLLELEAAPSHTGHPLRAPQRGKMSSTIRESCNAHLRARLWKRGKPVFDLQSDHADYEFVPDHGG